jgi:hypothetical protein
MTLEFFIPSNRTNKDGTPAPLDGINELVAAERAKYGPSLKRKNGRHAEAVCLEAMRSQGWTCPRCKCVVELTFVEPHEKRDPDNILGGAKFILDGITKPRGRKQFGAGAIEDDSQRWIVLKYGDIEIDEGAPGCKVRISTIGS